MQDSKKAIIADKMNRLALLDFDGTLRSGNISIELMSYLRREDLYPTRIYDELSSVMDRRSRGLLSYDDSSIICGELWAKAVKGMRRTDLLGHTADFFKRSKKKIYKSSYELVSLLIKDGYKPIVLSVGAHEIVSMASKELGVSEVYATEVEIKNGVYTGRLKNRLCMPDGKLEIIKRFSKTANLSDSFAFGDSIADSRMLEIAGIPVALNPSRALTLAAKEKGWRILNHKNVVSEVEKMLVRDQIISNASNLSL